MVRLAVLRQVVRPAVTAQKRGMMVSAVRAMPARRCDFRTAMSERLSKLMIMCYFLSHRCHFRSFSLHTARHGVLAPHAHSSSHSEVSGNNPAKLEAEKHKQGDKASSPLPKDAPGWNEALAVRAGWAASPQARCGPSECAPADMLFLRILRTSVIPLWLAMWRLAVCIILRLVNASGCPTFQLSVIGIARPSAQHIATLDRPAAIPLPNPASTLGPACPFFGSILSPPRK